MGAWEWLAALIALLFLLLGVLPATVEAVTRAFVRGYLGEVTAFNRKQREEMEKGHGKQE